MGKTFAFIFKIFCDKILRLILIFIIKGWTAQANILLRQAEKQHSIL